MISEHDSSSELPLDPDALGALRSEMGGRESPDYQEAIAVYLEDAPGRLAILQQAAIRRQSELLIKEAHYLKGSSACFGAGKMQELCKKIDALARADELDGMQDRVGELVQEFERVRQALQREVLDGAA